MARQPVSASEREDGSAGALPSPGWTPPIDLILARLTEDHRVELAKARALVVMYRRFIEDHGLTAPDASGAEALTRFRNAFERAGFADDMQHPELLADWDAA